MTIENETNEILDQGDVAEGFTPEEVAQEPEQAIEPEVTEEVIEPKVEKKKPTAEERQQQIAHQTKLKWDAERALQARQTELDAKIAKLEALEKQHGKSEDTEPNPNNYTEATAGQYIEDLANYKAEKRIKETLENESKTRKQQEQESQTQRIRSEYDRQYSDKIAKDPSFGERELNVARYLDLTKRDDLVKVIMEDDDRAEIIDYLGGNLELLEKLAVLSPTKVAKELGKITAQIQIPKSRTVSLANAPINPVRQTGSNAVRNVDDMDHESYSDYMNKKQFGF